MYPLPESLLPENVCKAECVGGFEQGLLRHDRDALLGYFGQEGSEDRNKWLRRVHRLSAFGIIVRLARVDEGLS